MAEDIPPTVLVEVTAELAQLRSCVSEFREGRAQLHSDTQPRRARTEATSKSVFQHCGVAPLSGGAVGWKEVPGQVHRGMCGGFSFNGGFLKKRDGNHEVQHLFWK